ncbi:MAG: O-antigen ligase family protein [Ferruginibacter sp.]|nr:O-antigen ligase family protein [Ferruginibacter sp.]
MSKGFLYFLAILMVPALAETINAKDFLILIPGVPFSLGRLAFLTVGICGLIYNKSFYFKSRVLFGMVLIFVGSLIGAIFSDAFLESVSRSVGNITLLVGAIGVATLCSNKVFQKLIDAFFVLNLVHWTYYVFNLMILNGFNAVSYSKLFTTEDAINHHVIGINSSVSCIYIALRFFYKQQKLRLFGYLIIFIGILNCLLTETRSNLVIIVLVLLLTLLSGKVKFGRILFISIPVVIVMFIVLSNIASSNESIVQRFDVTDEDYQGRTSGMRLDFIAAAFVTILENPFGRGVFGAEIEADGIESTMVHNQYLTFILAGGVFALVGIFFWFWEFAKIFRYTTKFRLETQGFTFAVVFSMLTFLLTLFTIEFTGMIFFLFISLIMYLSESLFVNKMATLKNRFFVTHG